MFKLVLIFSIAIFSCFGDIPIVINTWGFTEATKNAWKALQQTDLAVDALVEGCRTCQNLQCDFTVGYGGSPDENGESTLDALIFDGDTINMGAVGAMRNVKDAIGVARKVLENTKHSFLIGERAGEFANQLGFPFESLETNYSLETFQQWKKDKCQPNFWTNVLPDPTISCGPYKPIDQCETNAICTNKIPQLSDTFNSGNHDTIGMIVISKKGQVVAGTSTNGANHKIPGRVGDSPIPGAGAYADSEVGAAAGTGDGDVMMRFLPSFLAVEQMRLGASPTKAAETAIKRIAKKYPTFFGGLIAVDKEGNFGVACNGMDQFPFSLMNTNSNEPIVHYVNCMKA